MPDAEDGHAGDDAPDERAADAAGRVRRRGGDSPGHSTLRAPGAGGVRRPARYGLGVDFEERPEANELGRLIESTVLVNTAHPAYLRAVASRSEGYHAALTVAMALADVAVEPADRQGFVTTFLARWGEAIGRDRRRRKPPRSATASRA